MSSVDEKLIVALSFALAICRGALTDSQIQNKEMISQILDGTSMQSICNAINIDLREIDWNRGLTAEERKAIENNYLRFSTSAIEQSDEPKSR